MRRKTGSAKAGMFQQRRRRWVVRSGRGGRVKITLRRLRYELKNVAGDGDILDGIW